MLCLNKAMELFYITAFYVDFLGYVFQIAMLVMFTLGAALMLFKIRWAPVLCWQAVGGLALFYLLTGDIFNAVTGFFFAWLLHKIALWYQVYLNHHNLNPSPLYVLHSG